MTTHIQTWRILLLIHSDILTSLSLCPQSLLSISELLGLHARFTFQNIIYNNDFYAIALNNSGFMFFVGKVRMHTKIFVHYKGLPFCKAELRGLQVAPVCQHLQGLSYVSIRSPVKHQMTEKQLAARSS